jgi:hypothetical protein
LHKKSFRCPANPATLPEAKFVSFNPPQGFATYLGSETYFAVLKRLCSAIPTCSAILPDRRKGGGDDDPSF